MGGGSSTTNTTTIPPPTENEIALQGKQLELANAQLDAIKQQQAFTDKYFASIAPSLDAQNKLLQLAIGDIPDPNDPAVAARRAKSQELNDLILDDQLQRQRSGGGATEKEIAALRQAADASIEAGGRDVDRYVSDALLQLREEFAPSAGLRAGDTPVAFRADKALAEGIRQKGDLTAKVRSAEAMGRVNAPLATQQYYQAVGGAQSALAQASSQFSTDLREAAAANRLRLAGGFGNFAQSGGQLGLGLATGVPFNASQALAGYQQGRYASATTTSTTERNPGFLDYVSAAGSLLGGAGGAASGFKAISTRDLKDILSTYTGEDVGQFLTAVIATPVHRWRYKGGVGLDAETLHVGPTAEDWQASTGYGSSRTISLLDAVGVLMGAIQALHAKVEALEARA